MDDIYDVIIIGAGISGLVCGCYLAKDGIKVLIVEQQSTPGGYCTSFERKGYLFNACVHSLGSLRRGGILSSILDELALLNKIDFLRSDPTDRIITPDKVVFLRKDKKNTKKELMSNFPNEKRNIEKFFKLIFDNNFLDIVSRTKKNSFQELLDEFFSDYKLKAVLSILLGNLEVAPSNASALISIFLYREFIFDGGYVPKGGIHIFPNLLAKKFKEYGGELLLSTKATKIITKQKKVYGVRLKNGVFINTKFVVSNVDATFTFKKLLDHKSKEAEVVDRLEPSPSAFGIYLGLKKLNITPKHLTTWAFFTYDIEKCYSNFIDSSKLSWPDYFQCYFSSLIDSTIVPKERDSIVILIGANYENKNIWDKNKEIIYQGIIERVEKIIPNIHNNIEVKVIATPNTFSKATSNKNGACFGWASTIRQVDINLFPSETSIENLYLTGHWVTSGIGQASVPMVALCGKKTKQLIIKKQKNE